MRSCPSRLTLVGSAALAGLGLRQLVLGAGFCGTRCTPGRGTAGASTLAAAGLRASAEANANADFYGRLSAGKVQQLELTQALQEGRIPQGRRTWELMLEVLQGLHAEGSLPSATAYTAAICSCGAARRWELTLQLLAEMQEANWKPNLACYNNAVRACDHGMRWERALNLLEEMHVKALGPDAISYGVVISACDRSGQSVQALKLLNRMCEEGIEPELVTYSIALGSCRRKLRELVQGATELGRGAPRAVARFKPKRLVL